MNEGNGKGEELKSRKGHKPKANHPWRNTTSSKIHKFAKENSEIPNVNNYKTGGGMPQK